MVEKEIVIDYLLSGQEDAAAKILQQCELRYSFIDVFWPQTGDKEYYSYELNIEAPRSILEMDTEFKNAIENGITVCAQAVDVILQSIQWVLLIPKPNAAKDSINFVLSEVDARQIDKQWQIACKRVETDPEGAITLSRTLLESVCKFILESEQVTYSPKADLPTLYSAVTKKLNISPSQEIELPIKKMLGAYHTIVDSICNLRNKVGDAHGKGIVEHNPDVIDAELAVNLSGSISHFLFRKWEVNSKT